MKREFKRAFGLLRMVNNHVSSEGCSPINAAVYNLYEQGFSEQIINAAIFAWAKAQARDSLQDGHPLISMHKWNKEPMSVEVCDCKTPDECKHCCWDLPF